MELEVGEKGKENGSQEYWKLLNNREKVKESNKGV
jgi:hypothetical protein